MMHKHKTNNASTSTRVEDDSENESEDDDNNDGNKKRGFGASTNIYANIYKDSTRWYPGIITLLLRWKGSVYKLLWMDFVLFIAVYILISVVYRCVLFHYPEYRQGFELFCVFTQRFSKSSLPITFLIGLYVSAVVERWWSQFMALPWPDQLAMKLVAYIPGNVSSRL
jgi:hypothetical protein